MDTEIDERKKEILRTVVQSFVLNGKPVGSKTVSDTSGLGVSAATIRNEMSALESMGLLRQPHTSAGRVPTDLAYRYYVDMLMGTPAVSEKDSAAIEKLFTVKTREIESLFREASLLLSSLTSTTALVFAPFGPAQNVRHLDLVPLSGTRLMLIVTTARGQVGRRLIGLNGPVSVQAIEEVSAYLDERLAGMELEEIDVGELMRESSLGGSASELLRVALETTVDYLGSIEERVYIGGTANILLGMDSEGTESIRLLLEAMEKQYLILDLLKDLINEGTLTIRIGQENRLLELRKCAFIGTSYPLGADLFGSLGVLGPTSMDYDRTIGMVEFMAKNLGRRFIIANE